VIAHQNILVEREKGMAQITLNCADKMNPLDWGTVRELREAVTTLARDPNVVAVVITGTGRAFSAGGDLAGYHRHYRSPGEFRAFLQDFHDLLAAIEASEQIYVAAVNGFCVAGGLELILACDLVLAAEGAKIGDGHVNFGQLPGAGGSQRLPRAIGVLRAKRLMFSGELLPARECERIGLVGEVVADAQLLERAREVAAGLLGKSRSGLKGLKHLVNAGLQGNIEAGLALEMDYVHRYATTDPDATEGLLAFAEKRKPAYRSGRDGA
jgi:enoyl-CoA hydratase/carnithine racemase